MTRWLALAALAAVLAGVVVLEATAPDEAPDAAPAVAPRPGPGGIAAAETAEFSQIVAGILARPLFAADRRPAVTAPAPATGAGAADVTRLTGVIVGPSGRTAIFTDGAGHPLAVAEGGSAGHYIVQTIMPGQVTVRSSEGDRVLRPSFHTAGPAATAAAAGAGQPAHGPGR